MIYVRLAIAWFCLIGGTIGFMLSALRLTGRDEPLQVLLLSWGAIVYEGFNSVQIAHDAKKGGNDGQSSEEGPLGRHSKERQR